MREVYFLQHVDNTEKESFKLTLLQNVPFRLIPVLFIRLMIKNSYIENFPSKNTRLCDLKTVNVDFISTIFLFKDKHERIMRLKNVLNL